MNLQKQASLSPSLSISLPPPLSLSVSLSVCLFLSLSPSLTHILYFFLTPSYALLAPRFSISNYHTYPFHSPSSVLDSTPKVKAICTALTPVQCTSTNLPLDPDVSFVQGPAPLQLYGHLLELSLDLFPREIQVRVTSLLCGVDSGHRMIIGRMVEVE